MNNTKNTVLIISDNAEGIEALADIFKEKYNILTACGKNEAYNILHSKGNNINAAILNYASEEERNRILQRIAEDFKSISIVAVIPDAESENRVTELGAADCIISPINASVAEKRIEGVLCRSELRAMREENRRLKKDAESEIHLSSLMDNVPGGIAIIETDGITASCTYYNNALLKLFHMKSSEFLSEFDNEAKSEWLKTFIEKSVKSSKVNFSFCIEMKSRGLVTQNDEQKYQWIRVSASGIGRIGGRSVMYCIFIDVNEEKHQEQLAHDKDKELLENEERIENIMNNTPGALVVCEENDNGDLRVVYCSRGLAEIMGYDDYESFLAKLIEAPTAGTDNPDEVSSFKRALGVAAVTGTSVEQEFRCRGYNGRPIWVMMRGKLMCGEKGRTTVYGFINDITKEKEYEQELKISVYYDALTGLYNRNAFYSNAKSLLKDNPNTVYLAMRFNIGSFKLINDIMGRETGDKVLIMVADVLRDLIPECGLYARFFADQFSIMIPEGEIEPEIILGTIKREVTEKNIVPHDIQCYVGIYRITDRETSIEDICDRAAIACRSISGSFNQSVAYYDERMREEMLEEQEICDEAHRAIANNEFCIYYQSVYGIKAKKFVSAEALVRWNHPEKGLISPGKFIPVFEKNGFIAELDMYVLEQVCKYQKKRRDLGLEPFPISVNISRMSLYNPKLFDIINNLTKRYGVDPKYFRIEITESAYNDNPAQLLETVKKLRDRSYPVLMDDFGSGYSSLNTLKDIPIDMLKLDMKFMQDFEKNGRVGTIVTSVARMSKWLNLPMLAEGVETKEQYDFLESIGCSYIQGYLFAKPSSEETFTDLIAKGSVTINDYSIETYGIDDDINQLLGNNGLVSKLIGSVFGGLGIYELNEDSLEVIRVNEGYMQIMGYTPDDFTGEHYNIWDKLHPDDVDKSKSACLEALKTGNAVRATVRRYNRNGELLYLEGIHRRLGGSDENPIFCIAFNDITDRIKNDRIIKQANDRIKGILDATGAIVVDVDAANTTAFCSGDIDEYGLDSEKLISLIKSDRGLSELVHPDHKEEMLKFHNARATERISMEAMLKSSDGKYRWSRFTKKCSFDEDGKLLRIMGIINDIDAEKRNAIALEETRNQVELAMANIDAGIIFFEMNNATLKSKIKFSNKSFWKILGKSEPDPNFNFIDLIRKGISKQKAAEIGSRTAKKETNRFAFRLNREDGSTAWIELICTPTNANSGSISSHMIILTDITERYLNESRLEAIVSNYNGGLALVSRSSGEITLSYANDKFFRIFNVDAANKNEKEFKETLLRIIDYRYGSTDMEINTEDNKIRVVKAHAFEFESGVKNEENYVVTADDVTLKRREAVNRIAERSAYASTGLYDEVFKIDYKERTSVIVYNRLGKGKVENAKPVNLEYITGEWIEKNVHPEDRVKMTELLTEPMINADFTDMYAQVRFKNRYSAGKSDKYVPYGMSIVKSGTDTCMLFTKDLERIDDSHSSAEIAEMSRLYRLVAEQTHTTVIEYDHITGKTTSSPSLKLFAAGSFTEEQLSKKENYSQGFIVHPDDLSKFKKYIENLGKAKSPDSLTLRLKMADGSYKWCRITVSLTKNTNGKIIKSLSTINIVHDEVEARRKAEEADLLMRKTIRHIPMGIGIYKLDGDALTPLYVSDNTRKIFGLDDAANKVDPNIQRFFVKNSSLIPGTENEFTAECRRSNGSSFWISSKYTVKEENGEIIVYSALDDVTEKILAQHKQSVKDRMYQMLLNEAGTMIFYYDTDKDELTYHRPTGEEKDEHIVIDELTKNTDKLLLLAKDDRKKFIAALLRLAKNNAESTEELVVHIYAGGLPRHFKCFFKSICDKNGKVNQIIGKIDDVDDEVAKYEAVRTKAMYDSLCIDIYNKSTTEELIRAKLSGARSGALIMIDVDDFKSINDRLGHMFGDEFLKSFAAAIKKEFRDSDVVGRYGGDEFCIFIGQVTSDAAEKKCNQLLEKLSKIEIPEIGSVKSSIGVAAVTEDNCEYRQLLNQADSALYIAKNLGKNQVAVFDPHVMSAGSYRRDEDQTRDNGNVVLSSNPEGFSSLILRIFSALYSDPNVENGINKMMALVGETFDVSRVYIFEDNEDGTICSNTFEWCNNGVNPEIENLRSVSYERDLGGCYRDNFNDDNIFYCHDINTLIPLQREMLSVQGIKSMLQCAIMDGGVFKGYIGFDECRSNRFWTQEQIDALVFISKVISVFLMRDRSKKQAINEKVKEK